VQKETYTLTITSRRHHAKPYLPCCNAPFVTIVIIIIIGIYRRLVISKPFLVFYAQSNPGAFAAFGDNILLRM
jgi:hypothetical protein